MVSSAVSAAYLPRRFCCRPSLTACEQDSDHDKGIEICLTLSATAFILCPAQSDTMTALSTPTFPHVFILPFHPGAAGSAVLDDDGVVVPERVGGAGREVLESDIGRKRVASRR